MNYGIIIISIFILLIDQVTKALASIYLTLNKSIDIITNFFSLTLTNNYGAAFGIFKYSNTLLIIATLIILIILYKYMHSFKKNMRNKIAFGFILGGVFGNLIDRTLTVFNILNGVIDFFGFTFGSYDFPIFNVADMCLVIGVIMLVIDILFIDEYRKKKQKNG